MSDEPKAGPDDHLQLRPRANDPLGLGADRELGVGKPTEEGAAQGEGAAASASVVAAEADRGEAEQQLRIEQSVASESERTT